MSGDRLASSFGDPNAQPPTPKQTPTSAIFPSPVFETPKNNSRPQPNESSCGGWTPRFAEEYSVFNSTPGNLRGSQDEFGIPTTPYNPPSAGHKRPISAEDIAAAEVATHVNPFSPRSDISSLPPVDPHRRLPSSPNPLATGFDQSAAGNEWQASQDRTSKKIRRGTVTKPAEGQTATPPPSTRKGERRLAPRLDTNTMQNDQGDFGHADFADAGQQQNMAAFVTNGGDMFGYPLSATAPGFPDQRGFWAPDPGMAGMDIDFSAAGGDVFHAGTPGQRAMDSIDWGRTNQIFQETGLVPQQNQENAHAPAGRRQRPIESKASMSLDTSSADPSMFAGNYPTPIDDPFGIVGGSGGVDPGLLFSRPPSSSMEAAFDPSALPPSSSAPPAPQSVHPAPAPVIIKARSVRRSMSVKELGTGKRGDRMIVSSPTKSVGRPGLSRSFSESRGKKPVGRASLPTLAPAPRPQGQHSANSGVGANRPIVSQPIRPGGRSSPLKSHHHHRLSSLSSIPEALGPRARAQAKFTIDASGRARVETTVVVDDDAPPTIRSRHSAQPLRHQRWNSSEDDNSSSEDDDPIIIPSRNNSFVLPDPRRPSNTHPFHNSQRSISDRSTASYGTLAGGSQDGGESEAETVMNEATPVGGKSGDAASELRKLRQSRQRNALSTAKQGRPQPPNLSTAGFVGGYPGQDTISPTTLTDSSLPTPSTDSRSHGLRCVCHRLEADSAGDGFMVQCESCEMWLHGRCVNITKRTQPSVYICAFCANTPNMRGGRVRDNGRGFGAMGPPGSATSPLAHKSFKFR